MKKLAILVLSMVSCLWVIGCAGVGETGEERRNRYSLQTELEARQFMDDLDDVMLMDKAPTTSNWHVNTGLR